MLTIGYLKKSFYSFHAVLLRGIRFFSKKFITPSGIGEDHRRKEYILNTLLVGSIVFVFLMDLSTMISSDIHKGTYLGVSTILFSVFLLIYIAILAISRKGHLVLASYLFVGIYFILTSFAVYTWGFIFPIIMVGYILVIFISGILIGPKTSVGFAILISVTIITINSLQIAYIIPVDLHWQDTPLVIKDSIEVSIALLVITLIAWLYNRQIIQALNRANLSEKLLLQERDALEITVEERTKELKQLQVERVAQLYRFAEFGKLSSGIFHDLMNPLHAVVAQVENLGLENRNLSETKTSLEKAVRASRRMGDFLGTIRKQISISDEVHLFSLTREIQEAIDLLHYKAREAKVTISFDHSYEYSLFGNPLKFHQIALNLIANAIDACHAKNSENSIVDIFLKKEHGSIVVTITDSGCGIPPEIIPKVFDPFFTTKPLGQGSGIGLSTTKTIVEQDFQGTIQLDSEVNKGSVLTITLPIKN